MSRDEIKQLFVCHYAKMYAVARSILFDEEESKDVVSDVFESLLDGDVTLLPGREEHYLLTSVRNRCIKRLHHQEVRRSFARMQMGGTDEEELSAEADDTRLADVVEAAHRHLSEQELCIFRRRFVDEMSYDEIARAEGMSKVAVWKHLSHLIKVIREHLKPTES